MKKNYVLLTGFICMISFSSFSQSSITPINKYYRDLQQYFDSATALKTVEFVEQRWRIAGNSGFDESIHYVESILQSAGYKKEVKGEQDGILTYRIEKRPMKRPTWEPIDATVTIVGSPEPVLQLKTNKNMLAINSASTPADGVEAELVYCGKGTKAELDSIDVKGKIVFAETGVGSFYARAIEKGALGVLAYSIPAYNQPSKHTNAISFQGIPYKDSASQKWGILVSYSAREKLKAALQKGTVRLKVNIQSKIYSSEELTIIANIRGSLKPAERFVFSAHVQEPGANDNASGVGALAEMARVSAQLLTQGKLKPQRTITFLWGDEIVSTRRYITDDSIRAKTILWGMSLDMVGEDTKKTGGTFLIEKMPDPSAIWTRGEEKHTEWGGGVLQESQLRPHYFNDLVLNRCLDRAKQNNWIVKTNPFEGGSDHTPFLDAKKPGLLLWHFTDVHYHTDGDRIDMVSAEELKNVGIAALVSAYTLASADEATTILLIKEIQAMAVKRLDTELALSKAAIASGSDKEKEKHILEVWAKYYREVLTTMMDISVKGPTKKIMLAIGNSQSVIEVKLKSLLQEL